MLGFVMAQEFLAKDNRFLNILINIQNLFYLIIQIRKQHHWYKMLDVFAVILAAVAVCLVVTESSKAEGPVTELGYSMQGCAIYFQHAAVVGKIVDFDEESGEYIVYGRLSTSEGNLGLWTVYQTGRFFEVLPCSTDCAENLSAYRGSGVKLFGSMESGKEGKCILYATSACPYDPADDYAQGMEPAWTEGQYPDPGWLGFGFQGDTYQGRMCEFSRCTDLVNRLLGFRLALSTNGRMFQSREDDYSRAELVDAKNGKTYSWQDTALLWVRDPYIDPIPPVVPGGDDQREAHRLLLAEFRRLFPFQHISYLIGSKQGLAEATRASGGLVFVRANKGEQNSYLQGIPVIHPDLDRMMAEIEQQESKGEYSEWASPALFYGTVTPHYRQVEVENGQSLQEYDYAVFDGVYFSRDDPSGFVEYMHRYSNEGILLSNDPDYLDEGQLIPRESWKIMDLSESEAVELNKKTYVWLVGTRRLVYLYQPPGQTQPVTVTMDYGSCKDEPYYSLIDNYIVLERVDWSGRRIPEALGKGEFNFILNCLRDMSFRGGF